MARGGDVVEGLEAWIVVGGRTDETLRCGTSRVCVVLSGKERGQVMNQSREPAAEGKTSFIPWMGRARLRDLVS
jgi:hypothetical protein